MSSLLDYIPSPFVQGVNAATGGTPFGVNPQQVLGLGQYDPSNPYRQGAYNNAQNANAFGQQNAANYQQNQAGLNQSINDLRGIANGQRSVSAMQLGQGLQQNLASQQSMAASASPSNAGMAARNAAMNMNRAAYGLSGQQAVAGLQERNQAQQALGQLQLGQSGQNMQGAIGGYGAAGQGYGLALQYPQQTVSGLAQKGLGLGLGALLGGA